MFLMPVRTRSAILVLATAIGLAAAGPQTAAGAEAARARPGIRAADLVQRPTGFLHRALRLEDVVVVDRFGGQVFLVREDGPGAVVAPLVVVSPRPGERVRLGQRLAIAGTLRSVADMDGALDGANALANDLARAGAVFALVARSIRTEEGRELVPAPVLDDLAEMGGAVDAARVIGRRVDVATVTVRRRAGPRAWIVTDASGAEAMVRLRRPGAASSALREGELISVAGVVRKAPASLAGWDPDAAEEVKSRSVYVEASDIQSLDPGAP